MIRARWKTLAGFAVFLTAVGMQMASNRAAMRDGDRRRAEQARISEAWKATLRPRPGEPPRAEELQAELAAERKLRDLYSEQASAEVYAGLDQRWFAITGWAAVVVAGIALMTADMPRTPKVPVRCPTPV